MAGRIWIGPYKPLGVSTEAVPGGGHISVDASAGNFGPSPWMQLGLQAAEGAAGIATVVSEHLANDNEALVKSADVRLGEAEQALLFDPQIGYLNLQGQDALNQAPAVLDAYREAQAREMAALTDDDQRQMLQGLTERRLASFNTQVEQHSATERQRWYDTASDARIAQMQRDAGLYWSDDALLRRALGTARAEVRDKAERRKWDSGLTESALRQQTSRILVSAIEAAVERDPERAHSLRSRYDKHIEATDRAALDALLTEAQTRQRAQQASAAILNTTPPDGEAPTLQWQLQQADAITEPDVRIATIRTLHANAATAEARARALAEQVLARVLKDGLTDPSQIPVRDWVALDAGHREAIETRIDHNAAGTEPPPNPALVDELATQMTEAPSAFARRDLVPSIAHHPLPQWQRFRDLQAGIRRNDPTTEDEVYAIKRGLQLANKMLPADTPDDIATNYRAELVEELDTWRRLNGKNPDDVAIRAMLERQLPTNSADNLAFPFDPKTDPPIHQINWVRALPKGADKEAAAFFLLILSLMQGIIIHQKGSQRLPSPSQDRVYPPPAPPPAGGLPSEKWTAAPNIAEVQRHPEPDNLLPRSTSSPAAKALPGSERSAQLPPPSAFVPPPEEKQIIKGPELDRPPPPAIYKGPNTDTRQPPQILKGPDVSSPPPPTILKGPDTSAQQQPTILKGPDTSAPPPPTIYESSGPKHKHHNIPQFLWNPKRPFGLEPRYVFNDEVIRFFAGQITEVPEVEHRDQHDKYNAVAERAMRAYLTKTKSKYETVEEFALRMSVPQAKECFDFIMEYIWNPPPTENEREISENIGAREFLDNVSRHVKARKKRD